MGACSPRRPPSPPRSYAHVDQHAALRGRLGPGRLPTVQIGLGTAGVATTATSARTRNLPGQFPWLRTATTIDIEFDIPGQVNPFASKFAALRYPVPLAFGETVRGFFS